MLRIGLVVNPYAGLGGAAALKGSDGAAVQAQAKALGASPRALPRVRRMVAALGDRANQMTWLTWGGGMGQRALAGLVSRYRVLGTPTNSSSAADTQQAAARLLEAGVDLLLVAGGDGTVRDLLPIVGERVPVLGVPCGVKMHSGVFATTPERAAQLVQRLMDGGLVQSSRADVRDVDEHQLRQGQLATRFYGELLTPSLGGFLAQTKEAGKENESLAVADIVADILDDSSAPMILGPGSTCAAIKQALGMQASLLGFDLWNGSRQQGVDVTQQELQSWVRQLPVLPVLVLSFTRHQGFLLGRGNQQLSSQLIAQLVPEQLRVVGTRTKLLTLGGQPLLIDTNDPELDKTLTGLVQVTAGYQDYLWYRLSDRPDV